MKILVSLVALMLYSNLIAYAQTDYEHPDPAENQISSPAPSDPAAQTYEGFVIEFKKAANSNFTSKDISRIFDIYSGFILPAIDTFQLRNKLDGIETTYFPLAKLREEPFYEKDIQTLLASGNPYKRILAYVIIASSRDNSFNNALLKAMKSESNKGCRTWSGLALLYMMDNHTEELFDFLVKNEDFGDAHMLPFYLEQDKEALKETAYKKINSKNTKARILASQSLALTDPNPRTEKIVKDAIKHWKPAIAGYAINAASQLGLGNLKSLLEPKINNKMLRTVSLIALANSPSIEDQNYLASLVPTDGEVPRDILHAYLKSSKKDSIKTWLRLIRDNKIPEKYVFFISYNKLLISDALLDDVKDTIRKTKNHQILAELSRALANRTDDDSINILIGLLTDEDSSVRYWAGDSLKNCSSPLLVSKLPELIKNPNYRTVALTNLAIANKIDGLQDVYESIITSPQKPSKDWSHSAIKYLAAFPRAQDRQIFISTIEAKSNDEFIRRTAVAGLGQLHDRDSVPLIEEALHQEPPNDSNAIVYLKALGKIKGDKAKKIVESYKNSKNDIVRDLVAKILTDW